MPQKRSHSSSRGQLACNPVNQELPPSQHLRIDSDAGGTPRRRPKLPGADRTVAPPQAEEQSGFSDGMIAQTQVSQMLQYVETLLNPGSNSKNSPPASSAAAQPTRQRRQLHQQHQQQYHQFSGLPSDIALSNTLPFAHDATFPFSPNNLLESRRISVVACKRPMLLLSTRCEMLEMQLLTFIIEPNHTVISTTRLGFVIS